MEMDTAPLIHKISNVHRFAVYGKDKKHRFAMLFFRGDINEFSANRKIYSGT